MSRRSAEPVAKMCARLDPKQDMLKGGDADAVAKVLDVHELPVKR